MGVQSPVSHAKDKIAGGREMVAPQVEKGDRPSKKTLMGRIKKLTGGCILAALLAGHAHAAVNAPGTNCPIAGSQNYGCVKIGDGLAKSTTSGALYVTATFSGSGSSSFSAITSATTTNSILNANWAQTWAWNTMTTQTALTISTSSLTNGTLLSLQNTAAAVTSTGKVLSLGNTTTGPGYGIYSTMSGASNSGYAGYFSNSSATGYAGYFDGKVNIGTVTTGTWNGSPLTAAYLPAGAQAIQPSDYFVLEASTTGTQGNVYPNVFVGAGGNAHLYQAGFALANTMTSANGDPALLMDFQMPSTLPNCTMKLASLCLGAAGSGAVKYTVSDAMVASGSDPSAASLTGETQNTLTLTTTNALMLTKTTLTPSPVANSTSVVTVTFNRTGTTVGVPVTCRWFQICE